jgi:flagellar biosynthesis protein FlhG
VDFLLVDVAAGLSPSVLQIMAACQRRFVVLCDQPASIADAYGLIKVMSTEESLDEIYVLPNMAQSQAHGQQLFHRLNEVSQRFLQVTLRYIGTIESDELIVDAQKKYQSVLEWAPGSSGSRDFRRLAQAVVDLPPIGQASGRIQFFMNRLLHAQ